MKWYFWILIVAVTLGIAYLVYAQVKKSNKGKLAKPAETVPANAQTTVANATT